MVSIIMPAYNAANFIAETIASVKNISYNEWECVIVNDGSTDNTLEVIERSTFGDKRFRVISQPNSGPSVARNNAIAMSNGSYLLPLDADDLISAGYVGKAVKILQEQPGIKVVYCEAELFGDKKGRWHLPEFSLKDLLRENMIFCTAMFRKEDYLKTRGYDPLLREGREDWDFWIEMLKNGGGVHKLPDVHFYYRTRDKSRDKLANQQLAVIRKKIYENHLELYAHFFDNPIQVYHEHAFFKKKYNLLRKLTFRRPI